MPLILHLSDLHMSTEVAAQETDDVSESFVMPGERRRRVDDAEATLNQLVRRLPSSALNCVLFSGDVTDRGQPGGIEFLETALGILRPALSDQGKIILLTGNHDVNRDTGAKVITLHDADKVVFDYVDNTLEPAKRYILFSDSGLLILPINSSEFSGVRRSSSFLQALPVDLRALGDGAGFSETRIENIEKELKALLSEDAAIISPAQFDYLEDAMRHAEEVWGSVERDRPLLKVAAIHHQLLPVATRESVRPYESLVSLAQLRHFLRRHDFKVLVHGHKHRELIYRDSIPDIQRPESPYHDLLVIAGAPFGTAEDHDTAFQLLDFHNKMFIPKVEIQSFTMAHGVMQSIESKPRQTERLFPTPTSDDIKAGRALHLVGESVGEVHRRAIDLLDDEEEDAGQTLVCQLDGKIDPKELAALFAEQDLEFVQSATSARVPFPEDPVKRFDEIVEWWQGAGADSASAAAFTHGSRLRRYGASVDQVASAKAALRSDLFTSKAVLTLVEPPRDMSGQAKAFPSFCLLHFFLRQRNGERLIDCIAYFRKHEIRQWWLVNLAEIDRLRADLIGSLDTNEYGIKPGMITMISGRVRLARSLPQVSVPAIDRDVASDKGRAKLALMVHELFRGDSAGRTRAKIEFSGYMKDLFPPDRADLDGTPVAIPGLKFLSVITDNFEPDQQQPDLTITELLNGLAEANQDYLRDFGKAGEDPHRVFLRWQRQSRMHVGRLLGLVEKIAGVEGAQQ